MKIYAVLVEEFGAYGYQYAEISEDGFKTDGEARAYIDQLKEEDKERPYSYRYIIYSVNVAD